MLGGALASDAASRGSSAWQLLPVCSRGPPGAVVPATSSARTPRGTRTVLPVRVTAVFPVGDVDAGTPAGAGRHGNTHTPVPASCLRSADKRIGDVTALCLSARVVLMF